MIDGRQLLGDLQPLRRRLEDNLRERSEVPELGKRLREEWQAARQRERTAQTYEAWREDALAQTAVMWLLACVFVRFLEDNGLLDADPPRLAGPGARLHLARDQRTLYFQKHPLLSDRDYLYKVFEAVAALPAAAPIYDHRHNPIWNLGISGDAATQLIDFCQRIDPATGALVHDFTDPEWRTRFLGDLYQDLSESARKKYALLQTPDFVLQFILNSTLTPAIEEFGFREVRLIDPACGSGHFLLAAFDRLFRQWSLNEPGRNARESAQHALDQVSGVDLNPFAVAIARFRLLLAALRASNITRLVDAPAFAIDLAAGDSLLHGPRPGETASRQMYLDAATNPLAHVYATEDAENLKRILGRRYHVVVGNPPYITPKDAALNKAYRERFGSCHMKYSLAVPFTERLFDLAIEPRPGDISPAGYVGMITANSFMKREFGKKLIEQYIPRWDLTHVIDTSGAYIPGHGTPTVVLLGRHESPVSPHVRAVLGIKGEPTTPEDPAQGAVWRAIEDQTNRPGSSSNFISVSDADRSLFHKHPWSIGGGGAAELKERMDREASHQLGDVVEAIGITSVTGEDDLYLLPGEETALRLRIEHTRPLVVGELIRDWSVAEPGVGIWPYDDDLKLLNLEGLPGIYHVMWPVRAAMSKRKRFGTPMLERGLTWYEWQELYSEKLRTPLSITFASVATHNHLVLDRGGKVFKQSAPVIKLPPSATEEDHLALLGLLNSSAACFWMKQVFTNKAGSGIGRGIQPERWMDRFDFDATKLLRFPVVEEKPIEVARKLERLSREREFLTPSKTLSASGDETHANVSAADNPSTSKSTFHSTLERAIGLQEELDWQCYELYGLLDESVCSTGTETPTLVLGQRAFEIVLARRMAAGESESEWFERHGSTPITEFPTHWPEWYRQVVERRIELIESNAELALIEQPEYKRRWNVEPWEEQVERALREWLLNRLEWQNYWSDIALSSVARLADRARQDAEFMRVATLYRGQDHFDVSALVAELVESASVPFLPVLRYKASGLRTREQWERTWDLQRREDEIDARVCLPEGDARRLSAVEATERQKTEVGGIPVPPKYTSADFASSVFWQLRGKLDVPKEHFISYPFCERDADPSRVIAWAGWDYLRQAKALATYYVQMKESEGWSKERLTPLLAGLLELLPWLMQWHNDIDAEYGQRMGEYFDGFVDEETRALGLTRDAIRAWTPPNSPSRRRGRRTRQTDD